VTAILPVLLPPIAPDRARLIFSGFADVQILVVGDAMVDRFIAGRVTRISPEAPVPVVAFEHETQRIGGAANVAHNIAALGGHATLVAVTGMDDAAATLAAECRHAGIAPAFVGDPSRCTTAKVRIVTERNQQVARIDYESDAEITGSVEQRIAAELQKHAPHAAAIVISDYLKGCITRGVMETAVGAARRAGIPLLVDPKIPHIDYYAGAALVTPNHHEAETAANMRIRSDSDAREAARRFRERARCQGVLMTRGDQGMWLLTEEVEGQLPTSAREVSDVTGAGDTVIATMTLAIAAGATRAEAARLANEAAGISVSRFGPATVSVVELLKAVSASAGV
jgi:D-beta-D-heptose 7-phosphate kinase/D-beta-D-heptose 1-phosphate adenosyltransferase